MLFYYIDFFERNLKYSINYFFRNLIKGLIDENECNGGICEVDVTIYKHRSGKPTNAVERRKRGTERREKGRTLPYIGTRECPSVGL